MIFIVAFLAFIAVLSCIGEAYYERSMPRLRYAIAMLFLLLFSIPIFAQSAASYSSSVTVAASNVPPGAKAPVYSVPNAKIAICITVSGTTCSSFTPIFADLALSSPLPNPLTADSQGRYYFYSNSGNYTQIIFDQAGNYLGQFPLSLGSAGGSVRLTPNLTGVATDSSGNPYQQLTAPGSDTRFNSSAICSGGTAYSASLSTYDANQPTLTCALPASSSVAYLSFNAAASVPQYATQTFATPPYWTGSDLEIVFNAASTSGSVTWTVTAGCTNPGASITTVSYGAAVSLTTAVSSTSLGTVNTALIPNFVLPGANGCAAGTTGPGSIVTYRVTRSSSDSLAGMANLIGTLLVSRRSQ